MIESWYEYEKSLTGSKDYAFASRLVNDLNTAGADAWMGHIDLILGDLLLGIDEGLANCQWFVFVLTPDLGASLGMKGWADAATNLLIKKKIEGLVFIELGIQVDKRQLPLAWRTAKFINATLDYESALHRTLEAVGLQPPIETTLAHTAQSLSSSQETMDVLGKTGTAYAGLNITSDWTYNRLC